MSKARHPDWKQDSLFEDNAELLDVAHSVVDVVESTPPPGIADAVMLSVRPKKLPWWRRVGQWTRQPVTVRFTPLTALEFAVVLLVATSTLFSLFVYQKKGFPLSDENIAHVAFSLNAAGAEHVALIGSFNGWSPKSHTMRPGKNPGEWIIETTLTPGRHEYAFLVDGKPVVDPKAPVVVNDDFGNQNAVVYVPGEQKI